MNAHRTTVSNLWMRRCPMATPIHHSAAPRSDATPRPHPAASQEEQLTSSSTPPDVVANRVFGPNDRSLDVDMHMPPASWALLTARWLPHVRVVRREADRPPGSRREPSRRVVPDLAVPPVLH